MAATTNGILKNGFWLTLPPLLFSQRFGTGDRAGEEFILDGDIESTTLTVEGFYDITLNGKFAPYVKAGVGVSRNSYSARLGGAGVADFDPFDGTPDGFYDAYADETSTEFAWNVGLGGSVALNDQFTLFGEYQYASFGDASTGQDDFTDGFRVDASAHEVLLGIPLCQFLSYSQSITLVKT